MYYLFLPLMNTFLNHNDVHEPKLHRAAEGNKPNHLREKKKGDLIEASMIITGKEDVEPESLFTTADNITRTLTEVITAMEIESVEELFLLSELLTTRIVFLLTLRRRPLSTLSRIDWTTSFETWKTKRYQLILALSLIHI